VVVKIPDRKRLVAEEEQLLGEPEWGGPRVAAGATLMHESGGFAGTVRDPLTVERLKDVVDKDGRLCWSLAFIDPLRVCSGRQPDPARGPSAYPRP
jgi:hypothetical protein